jgi:hypothetical protein
MAAAETEECPDAFVCPITLEVMRDPVVFDGDDEHHTFERAAAVKWVGDGAFTHPVTGAPLASIVVKPNRILRNAINDWREWPASPPPLPHLLVSIFLTGTCTTRIACARSLPHHPLLHAYTLTSNRRRLQRSAS